MGYGEPVKADTDYYSKIAFNSMIEGLIQY